VFPSETASLASDEVAFLASVLACHGQQPATCWRVLGAQFSKPDIVFAVRVRNPGIECLGSTLWGNP